MKADLTAAQTAALESVLAQLRRANPGREGQFRLGKGGGSVGPGCYRVEVLAPEDGEGSGLYWQREGVAGGLAWRVVDGAGREVMIYDSPTVAHDARNSLNT
jgi:hypothetical protein